MTGTPTTPGTYSFQVHAVDASGDTGDGQYTIVVAADQPALPEVTATTLHTDTPSLIAGQSVILTVWVVTNGGSADEGVVTITDTASGHIVASGAVGNDGTARFAASDAQPVTLVVAQAATSMTFSGTSGTVTAGTPIVLVATATRVLPATGAAGQGEVHFIVDGIDRHVEPAAGGSASYSLTLPPGDHRIGTRFIPTSGDEVGSESERTIVVTAATATELDAPTGVVTIGQTLTYSAAVTPTELGVALTGTVTFRDSGTVLATVPVVNGMASHSVTATDPGVHAITVEFSGDAYYDASTSPVLAHTVVAPVGGPLLSTTTTLAGSAARVGEPLLLTATVVADGLIVPTGSVTFLDQTSGVTLGTVTLDGTGVAALTLARVTGGDTIVSATYDGDARLLGSSDTITFNPAVAATRTTLSSATTRVGTGASVDLIAQVVRQAGGVPDAGTVAFLADGVAFAHVPTDGSAPVTATSNPLTGPTVFTAEFTPAAGSADGPSTSAPLTIGTVGPAPAVTVTAALAADGSASGTIRVSPPAGVGEIPTGDVTLTTAGAPEQTLTLTDGGVDFAYPAGTLGTAATLVANYQGDLLFAPAAGSTEIERMGITPTQTMVEVSNTQVLPDQPVSVTIHVVAEPAVEGGMVEVTEDGNLLASIAVQGGVAVVPLTGLDLGANMVTARYLGTPDHASSEGNRVSIMVREPPVATLSLVLSADPGAYYAVGQTITVSARVDVSGATASNIAVVSPLAFDCPQTSLVAAKSMICTSPYPVTEADLDRGQIKFVASATADGATAADDSIVLQSVADTISDTFQTLSDGFVADRARVLGAALPLPDILERRNAGTRAGTVEASTDETGQLVAFTSSLAEWRNWAATEAAEGIAMGPLEEPLPVNIWIDAKYAIHAVADGDERWGSVATVALGADYMVTDDILAGLMVQGDWSAQTSGDGSVTGSGFLIGPYVSIALNDNLSLDAVALYGQSSNTAIAPMFGKTFSGDFETSRFYAKAALNGYFEIDQLTLRPNATFVLTSESSGGYAVRDGDGGAVAVPGGDHLQYRLTAGASAEYAIALDNGATLTPMVGLDVGLAGDLEGGLDPSSSFLGTLTAGFRFEPTPGLQLDLELRTELDSGGFSSSSVRATIVGAF